jgi:hypothetical protein
MNKEDVFLYKGGILFFFVPQKSAALFFTFMAGLATDPL